MTPLPPITHRAELAHARSSTSAKAIRSSPAPSSSYGTYTVKDGGRCAITLNGLDEYVSDGNTLEGDIEIVKDDKINFTVGDVVWELNRA